jgi:sensor histidine kinase YesM
MAYHELRQRLRQRVPHVLILGFAVGATDELQLLPQDLAAMSPIAMFASAALVFFNATLVAFVLVFCITLAEHLRLAQTQRVLTLSLVVLAGSLLAAALVILVEAMVSNEHYSFSAPETQGLFFHMLWIALAIGFLTASYFTVWERARLSATRLRDAELERQGIEQQVVESRLNVMKARVEPEFLFRSIGEIQRLYRRDVESAENRLDDLIAYLRAALPQMRGGASTLGDELYLATTYLRLHDEAFDGRLQWSLDIDDELDAAHFPPMALLPLVDDALRRGAALDPPRLNISVRASAGERRLKVQIEDDCANPRLATGDEVALLAQERAFVEFFGGGATVRREAAAHSGTRIILEADHGVGARDYR